MGLLNRTQAHLDPLVPLVEYLAAAALCNIWIRYLWRSHLLSCSAARLRVPHPVSVVLRVVYTHVGTHLLDDISHSVLAHHGDEGVPSRIILPHGLLQSGIGSLRSIDRLETVLRIDCNMELLKPTLLLF